MLRFLPVLLLIAPVVAAAQPSPQGAFGLSIVVPGLGHRAVHGDWDGAATAFALADAGLWLGLAGSVWRHGAFVQSYETLAAAGAGADVRGKDRRFFLQLATFQSSDAYREQLLRNRAWDAADDYADPAYAWAWASEDDFFRYRALREDAESARRRIPLIAGLLVGNRLLAGISAVRAARRADAAPAVTAALAAPPPDGRAPLLRVRVNF